MSECRFLRIFFICRVDRRKFSVCISYMYWFVCGVEYGELVLYIFGCEWGE